MDILLASISLNLFYDMEFHVESMDFKQTFKMKPNLLQFMSHGKLPC